MAPQAAARRPAGNPRWIKDSDLRKGTWMTQVDSARDLKPKLSSDRGDPPAPIEFDKPPNYGIVNYDGTWAPVPEDWDTRPGFWSYNPEENIESWMSKIYVPEPQKLAKEPFPFTMKDPTSANFHQAIPNHRGGLKRYYFTTEDKSKDVMGPIVPDYWRPDFGLHRSLGDFWKSHVAEAPPPCDEHDLQDVKPWWDQAPSPLACFLSPLDQPQHKGIDPNNETAEQRRKRLVDQGSEHAIKRYRNRPRRGKGRHWAVDSPPPEPAPVHVSPIISQAVAPEQLDGATQEVEQECPVDESIRPKVNMYLRRAHVSDMAQATEIYNHYVAKTVRVPECAPVLPNHMLARYRAIQSVSHTFVVACLASSPAPKVMPGKRNKQTFVPSHDRIIGFAYSDDFNDPTAMYRFLAEVEVYTDPDFSRKGIASCLIDRVLTLLDPGYLSRGDYEVRDEHLGRDATRWITCLWINFPHVPEENENDWMSKWLVSFGFEQTGNHKKVGYKNGKRVNLSVYTRHTDTNIDPKAPPPHISI